MNFSIVRAIFIKEIAVTLRDKRTLVAMLAAPILLYPALFVVAVQMAIHQTDRLARTPSRVAVVEAVPELVAPWLRETPNVLVVPSENPARDLADGHIDAIVMVSANAQDTLRQGGSVKIQVQFDAAETASLRASSRLIEGLDQVESGILGERLEKVGIGREYVSPLDVSRQNMASPTKVTGSVLGSVLPLIMVLMVGIGAFYPAVDLTAGEKQRGTFETLLSTPASKLEIVTGKFLTVFLISMLAGALNLGSMMATFAFQLAQLPYEYSSTFQLQLPAGTGILMLLVMMPLAFFISAAIMSIAVFARTFKEAQNYVMPFFLLILFPAAAAAVPGNKLEGALKFTPIANIALLFKELMIGDASLDALFSVLLSTTAFALIALLFAAWLFQREDVVLSSEHGFPFSFKRSRVIPRIYPTPGIALSSFATCLLLLFYIGTLAQARSPFWGILLTQWILILLPPLAFCWLARVRLRPALSLYAPAPLAIAGSVLITVGWLLLVLQLSVWQGRWMPIPDDMAAQMPALIQTIEEHTGLVGLLIVVALSPAVCEEILFRGVVLSGLRTRLPMWAGILLVGLLFGLLHLSVFKLIVTSLSGTVLAYLVWRSGSIYLGMAAHFVNNAASLLLRPGFVPSWVENAIIRPVEKGQNLSLAILLPAVVVAAVGIIVLEYAARSQHAESDRA